MAQSLTIDALRGCQTVCRLRKYRRRVVDDLASTSDIQSFHRLPHPLLNLIQEDPLK